VVAYAVNQRTRELGIRMALGAQRRDVLLLVIGQGMRPALMGLILGVAGAFGLTRFLAAQLFEIKPTDPATFTAVSLALVAVAFLACWLPARRAARVDPMVALRQE
jgi:putative ABC transport system permease protein